MFISVSAGMEKTHTQYQIFLPEFISQDIMYLLMSLLIEGINISHSSMLFII